MYKTSSGIIIPTIDGLEVLSQDYNVEGIVYKYLSYAFKLLKPNYDMYPKTLEWVITNFIHELCWTPLEAVFDENNRYVGYLMNYLENLGLQSMKCNSFLDCSEELKECFDFFSENNIYTDDVWGNFIINQKIYLIDFDRYFNNDRYLSKDNLKEYNYKNYNDLIFSIVSLALFTRNEHFHQPYKKWKASIQCNDARSFFEKELKNYSNMKDYIEEKREHILKKHSI